MNTLFRTPGAEAECRARYREILAYWPVANEHITLPTSQGDTFVVACGPREAPPLILLHGSLSNSAMWIGDVALWAQDFRIYAVDVIGEPGLSAPSRPPLDSDAHANWLDEVRQGLGLQRAALVGVSLGGWLALDYATRRPERVDKLVVLCPGGVGRQKSGFLAVVMLFQLLGLRRQALEYVLGRALDAPPVYAAFLTFLQRSFRPRLVKLPVFSDAALRRLTMPVLAIVGDRDVMLDSAGTRERLQAVGAEVRTLAGCGHLITGQSETIAAFLQRRGN